MADFTAETVSDQKRLARGEQWLFARSLLRAWHRSHTSDYRILTLAGGAPAGEINCIRELMPKAHITAIDKDEGCVLAAMDAGADDAIKADLSEWTMDGHIKRPNAALTGKCFDVVNLDLCAGASAETKELISIYRSLVYRPGILMVTFSYGRDVVEFFKFRQSAPGHLAAVPESIANRIAYLFGQKADRIASVILYQGNQMPMCSVVLLCVGHGGRAQQRPLSFTKLQEGDFELAVLHPDVRMLYDCPEERILALRRSHAALRAVATRKANEAA